MDGVERSSLGGHGAAEASPIEVVGGERFAADEGHAPLAQYILRRNGVATDQVGHELREGAILGLGERGVSAATVGDLDPDGASVDGGAYLPVQGGEASVEGLLVVGDALIEGAVRGHQVMGALRSGASGCAAREGFPTWVAGGGGVEDDGVDGGAATGAVVG